MTARRFGIAVLGLLSIVPLTFGVTAVACLLPELRRTTDFERFSILFHRAFYGGLVVWVVTACLGISFVVLAARNKSMSEAQRGLWIAMLLMAGVIVMPFFWYRYLWCAPRV